MTLCLQHIVQFSQEKGKKAAQSLIALIENRFLIIYLDN